MYTEIITNLPMEDGLEEEEIKIEYNESFETDPLCEKSVKKSIARYDVPVGLVLSSPRAQEYESNLDDIPLAEPGLNNPDVEQVEFDNLISTEPQAAWYRDIDDSGKLICQFCDLTYSTIQTVRHHVKTKHPDDATALKNIIKNNKRNPKLKCHICKKRFKLIHNLKDHVKEHYSKNFQQSCKVCYATFKDEKEMIQHLCQNHEKANIKTHRCTLCGYQTPKLSHFTQHKNTHIQRKNLKCDFCDYATNYLPNLKIHFRIHSNEKPYSCSFEGCDYRCAAKSALRSHQLKHNPKENMLYCDQCTYTTVYRNSLKKHTDSHERNTLKDS